MKQFFSGLLLSSALLTSPGYGQSANLAPQPDPADSLRLELNHILAPLDKSAGAIPSRFLFDYGTGWVRREWLKGQLTDSNQVTLPGWRLAYEPLSFRISILP